MLRPGVEAAVGVDGHGQHPGLAVGRGRVDRRALAQIELEVQAALGLNLSVHGGASSYSMHITILADFWIQVNMRL